jgi:hypothetical protein
MYHGAGLGNQLATYVTARCIALDKGYDFGVLYPERFKAPFLNLDMGKPVIGGVVPVEGQMPSQLPDGIEQYYLEAGDDKRTYDQNLINVPDNTMVHGYMQGEDYFKHRKDEIREWLKVDGVELDLPEDVCVINFRGGEYIHVPSFFLPISYWKQAVENMRKINPKMKFKVVTDDVATAKIFFGTLGIEDVTHEMMMDWLMIHNAHYLILSNSSFAFFPAWTNTKVKMVIGPKYWGNHNANDGTWSLGYNIVGGWHYQNKDGNLEICKPL